MTNRDANQYNRLLLALCGEIAARLRGLKRPRLASLDKGLRVVLALVSFFTLTLTVMHREDADGYQATHLFFMPRRNWEMDHGRGMLYEPHYYSKLDEAILLEEVNGARLNFESEYDAYGAFELTSVPSPPPSAEQTSAYHEWLAQEQADYTAWFMRTRASYAEWLKGRTLSFEGWLAGRSDTYRAAYAQELTAQEQAAQAAGTDTGSSGTNHPRHTQGGTVRRAPHAPAFGSNNLPVDNTCGECDVVAWDYAGIDITYPLPATRRDDTPTPPPRITVSL
ncbi:MAG: hypothetical protein WCD37_00670 [Chloroflexia bacterium]